MNLCRTKSFVAVCRKHKCAEKCSDLGGTFPCMRYGKRSKHANISGPCQGVGWMDKAYMNQKMEVVSQAHWEP